MTPDTRTDLETLQGRWLQVRFEENGLVDPPDSHGLPGAITTITGTRFHVAIPGGETILEGLFELDATTQPKSITWIDTIGEDAGKRLPAIYRLEPDSFVFVAADAGMNRPTEFTTRPGLTLRGFVRA
ncbi:TIGR03067 domain-containing protein [Pannonibacter tanglangensis]|uniref:TIGR03067 domain-containing protein n=1 Tax=Pannonibacter tanglangensis TaxID=2750084 RepID=A0ABW9ZHY9_9HYPH|nr:TIGR03067 domain-containing protein [Pannonibacter sp. XCT-34]NBN64480.1 TIGR03067 domain-containing protein [Pannonibacter sp. XCT-34]